MISQYAYAYDDADGFAEVFAEDGVFEVFVPRQSTPVVRLQSSTRTMARRRASSAVRASKRTLD
jgi:hypothetical protein